MLLEERDEDAGVDFSFHDMVDALRANAKWIAIVTVLTAGFAATVVSILPKYYAASTTFMAPQSTQNAAGSALAQLGMLAGAVGGGVKSQDELYVALLRARVIQDRLVSDFKLVERYEAKSEASARQRLSAMTRVGADKKTGIISLEVEDTDPKVAQAMADAYFAELVRLLRGMALTDAKQRREFYQEQLANAKEALSAAEARFHQERLRSGFISGQVLAESSMRNSVELRAQLLAKEVQLASMRAYATPQNEAYKRIQLELSALRAQLDAVERGQANAKQSPPGESRAAQAYRELQIQEAVLIELNKQLEFAKLTEASGGPALQQIDVAEASEHPVRPRRVLLSVGSGMLALFLSVVSVLGFRWWRLSQATKA